MNDQYGKGNWERSLPNGKGGKGPGSDYSKIKKYGGRAFMEWLLGTQAEDEDNII